MGIALIIASLITNGLLFVFEAKLLSKYHLEPLQVIGLEGIFGITIEIILVLIFSFIPCPFGPSACVFAKDCMPFMENAGQYFTEIVSSGGLLFFVILGMFSIATFNVSGVAVTKYISPIARSIGDVTRTTLVWLVGIIITASLGANDSSFQW